MDEPCELTNQMIPLGRADGCGGMFALWVHGARQGRPAATVDTAPVVHIDSEASNSVVAHSLAGFLARQCAGGDMALLNDSESEGEESGPEERGPDDVSPHDRFVAWVRGLGIVPMSKDDARAYMEWSNKVCPSMAFFGVDVTAVECAEDPPAVLHAVLRAKYWDRLAELLAAGGDPNADGGFFGSLIYAAADLDDEGDALEGVSRLLRAGADPNNGGAGVLERKTPLMAAVEKGHTAVVERLLKAGARVDEKSSMDDTALVCAVRKGALECVKVLHDAGANASVVTKDGETLVEVARAAAARSWMPAPAEVVALVESLVPAPTAQ